MHTPLLTIEMTSIYKKNGIRILMPSRFAWCTPDTRHAMVNIRQEVEQLGGNLYISDLFRTYDMQLQAYMDYVTKKKKAFSPPPGGSMHEAGRAFDIDLANIKISLADFWDIAKKYGVTPIINKPNKNLSEAWHFDCRGSHHLVYEHYRLRRGTNIGHPYRAMATSGILSAGLKVEFLKNRLREARLQSAVIRLGQDIGNIDGYVGPRTRAGLEALGLNSTTDLDTMLDDVEFLLQRKYPVEFSTEVENEVDVDMPDHITP